MSLASFKYLSLKTSTSEEGPKIQKTYMFLTTIHYNAQKEGVENKVYLLLFFIICCSSKKNYIFLKY